jgi:hypothetical protein
MTGPALSALQTFAARLSPARPIVAIPAPRAHPAGPARLWAAGALRCTALVAAAAAGLLFAQRERMIGVTLCVPGTPVVVSGTNPFSRLDDDTRAVVSAHEARHVTWIRANGCATAYATQLFGSVEQRALLEIDAGCAELPYYMAAGHLTRAAAEDLLARSLASTYGSMRELGLRRTLTLTRRACR